MADEEYTYFGDVARSLGSQAQYCSRYLNGQGDYPNLGRGLRIRGTVANYHALEIHKDDVDEFIKRYNEYISWRDDPDNENPAPTF